MNNIRELPFYDLGHILLSVQKCVEGEFLFSTINPQSLNFSTRAPRGGWIITISEEICVYQEVVIQK